MSYTIMGAGKTIVKRGGIADIPSIVERYGERVFLVTGKNSFAKSDKCAEMKKQMEEKGIKLFHASAVEKEPSVQSINEAAEQAREFKADVILAVGGGSVLDTGKAVSAMTVNEGSISEYLEGIGTRTIVNDPLSLIAVPTTAGTGSEATKNAVVTSLEDKYKKSIRHEKMFAKVALLDAELTLGQSRKTIASSGMDAICQLIEGYTTREPNSFCEALAIYYVKKAVDAIKICYDDEKNIDAREDMLTAANASGVIIACSGLGAAHGIAAGLGANIYIPHGIACAIMLPHIMKFNYERGVKKYEDIAYALNGNRNVAKLIDDIFKLNEYLDIPYDLKGFNIDSSKLDVFAASCMGNSLRRNPVEVTKQDARDILEMLI